MDDLVVIVPSRGRPNQLLDLIEAVEKTAAGSVRVLPCLDNDDPAKDEYDRLLPPMPRQTGKRRTLSGWTNHAAKILLDAPDPPKYLASFGDDHRPRTPGWDCLLIGEIRKMGSGIAYGNDLLQGANLPTAWVMSAEIVRTLGWMMLPTCEHMYVDTATLEIGNAIGRITYRPDVIIEHLHPLAGKAEWDASYQETNTHMRYQADAAAFDAWKRGQLDNDVARIRRRLG